MPELGDGARSLAERFSARFLYGTSRWNGRTQLVVVLALLVGFALGMLVVPFAHGRVLHIVVVIACGLAICGVTSALLYWGARHATLARAGDVERLRMESEQRVAERLQRAFQQQLPVLGSLGFSATYVPASTGATGGDWYDAFELPDSRIMFSIGDVAGHGVEAAVIMSRARQAIIAVALGATDPGEVFERANLTMMLQDTKFATAICGYIDPETLRVAYATAGHPPGILVGADGVARLLEYDGLPLGVAHDASYPTFAIQVEHGALLVLYTDGLLEYDRDVLAGEQRILAAVSAVAARHLDNPAAAICDAIFAGYEPTDDVAIMTIAFAQHPAAATADEGMPRWSVGVRGVRAPFTSRDGIARAGERGSGAGRL